MTDKTLWTATAEGIACREAFEVGQGQPRFNAKFNPTTELYHDDDGIGPAYFATNIEWDAWSKAWQAARSFARKSAVAAGEPITLAYREEADWIEAVMTLADDERLDGEASSEGKAECRAELRRLLNVRPNRMPDYPHSPAPSASSVPGAIYQIELDSVTYEDVSREKYERAFPGARRIVYVGCADAPSDARDAARWRYAVKHWLDEHIATKQADEAIAAIAPTEKT